MKIICIGRNYAAHIKELANERPSDPVIFMKPDSAVLPKEQDLYIPEFTSDLHYELEVLVRIKKVGKHIDPRFAPKYYDELSLGIDFTARDLQSALKEKGLPWEKAKGFDGSAVIGPWLPVAAYSDLQNLHFTLSKNGKIVQDGHTAHMLWKINELIAYISTFFTLKKGDVIFTGTPAGVGPVQAGDVLKASLEGEELFTLNIK